MSKAIPKGYMASIKVRILGVGGPLCKLWLKLSDDKNAIQLAIEAVTGISPLKQRLFVNGPPGARWMRCGAKGREMLDFERLSDFGTARDAVEFCLQERTQQQVAWLQEWCDLEDLEDWQIQNFLQSNPEVLNDYSVVLEIVSDCGK
eukprot:UN23909